MGSPRQDRDLIRRKLERALCCLDIARERLAENRLTEALAELRETESSLIIMKQIYDTCKP